MTGFEMTGGLKGLKGAGAVGKRQEGVEGVAATVTERVTNGRLPL